MQKSQLIDASTDLAAHWFAKQNCVFWSTAAAAAALPCMQGPLEDREALLKSLASHLVDKIIVDVTNVHYLFGESEWGRISSTLLNRDALGAPARWTTAFKATIAVCLEVECSQKTLGLSLDDELRVWTSHLPELQFHPAGFVHSFILS